MTNVSISPYFLVTGDRLEREDHNRNIYRTQSTLCRKKLDDIRALGEQACRLRSNVAARPSPDHCLTTGWSGFAVPQAEFPCSGQANSLFGRIEFPVISAGNLAQKMAYFCGFASAWGRKAGPKTCRFPVNSLFFRKNRDETRSLRTAPRTTHSRYGKTFRAPAQERLRGPPFCGQVRWIIGSEQMADHGLIRGA